MDNKKQLVKYQHTPLRTPQGWRDQEASLVRQLEAIIDDLYRKIGKINEEIEKLKEEINV